MIYEKGELIYSNPLSEPSDTASWIMEGQAKITFKNGKMQMSSVLGQAAGQAANFVYWCDKKFPDNIIIEWDFSPLSEEGLAILFFAADGQGGKDLFDPSLKPRTGPYIQYHTGDINAFHVSYYRRSEVEECALNVANLRKSAGFYLVTQGADPIPAAKYRSEEPYRLRIVKTRENVEFFVNDLAIFKFSDDGKSYGDHLTDGYIGLRQKTPLVGEYSNLRVYMIKK